jgi:transcriptional regulator with XRE-family HTH domain
MKDINCAAVIIQKRREKGLTQEDLAAYLGVTKASVSKWETGVSYPDITQLPLLAAFFEISIDCLMDYSPQMADSDIKRLHERLAQDFTKKPFEEVITECGGIIKKYYSCHLLLLRMAKLYLNHAPIAGNAERGEQILREAIRLCERITANSKDQPLIWSTLAVQAHCHLLLNEGAAVLGLLGESLTDSLPNRTLIAQAYKVLGNEEKAQESLQVDLFLKLMEIFDSMMAALQNNLGDLTKAEPVYLRAEVIADTFNMKHLNANNVAVLHTLGAHMYQMGGMPENAIASLGKFADVCINDFFPISVKADSFFDKLDNFLAENITPIPRSEEAVKKDVAQYHNHPNFEPLRENPDFKKIVKRIENFVGGAFNG